MTKVIRQISLLSLFVWGAFPTTVNAQCNLDGRSAEVVIYSFAPEDKQSGDDQLSISVRHIDGISADLASRALDGVDLIVADGSRMGRFIASGQLGVADGIPSSAGISGDDVRLIASNGETRAIVLSTTSPVWVFRKEKFEQLGLDLPRNYEDLFTAIQRAREAGLSDHPLALSYRSPWSAGNDMLELLISSGTPPVFEGEEVRLDEAAVESALNVFSRKIEFAHPELFSQDTPLGAFLQGDAIAMRIFANRLNVQDFKDAGLSTGEIIVAGSLVHDSGRASIQFWDGIAFPSDQDNSGSPDPGCVLERFLMQSDVHEPAPVKWGLSGAQWSFGGQGVITNLSRGATWDPGMPELDHFRRVAGEAVIRFMNAEISADKAKTLMADEYRAIMQDIGGSVNYCVAAEPCFPDINPLLTTVGGDTCSNSECSGDQVCCDGKCKDKCEDDD